MDRPRDELILYCARRTTCWAWEFETIHRKYHCSAYTYPTGPNASVQAVAIEANKAVIYCFS